MRAALILMALLTATILGSAEAQQRDVPFRLDPPVNITPPANPSPYLGFETRDVKTLSPERIDGLKRGAGLGYALAAEINGYPGPAHVLELADQLELDPGQRERTQKLFERMRKEAIAAGEALIAAEAHLDRMFTLGQATVDRVEAQTAVAAGQEARLRSIHLKAHIEMMEILLPEQIESYSRLRGYVGGGGHGDRHRR
jgi:Spy/CpxP family protein refolding chaperone